MIPDEEAELAASLVQAALVEIKEMTIRGWIGDHERLARVGYIADLVDHSSVEIIRCPREALERIATRVGRRWQYDWLVEKTCDYFTLRDREPVAVWCWENEANRCTRIRDDSVGP